MVELRARRRRLLSTPVHRLRILLHLRLQPYSSLLMHVLVCEWAIVSCIHRIDHLCTIVEFGGVECVSFTALIVTVKALRRNCLTNVIIEPQRNQMNIDAASSVASIRKLGRSGRYL